MPQIHADEDAARQGEAARNERDGLRMRSETTLPTWQNLFSAILSSLCIEIENGLSPIRVEPENLKGDGIEIG